MIRNGRTALAGALLLAALSPASADMPRLRAEANVTEAVVRLSDLVDNAGRAGATPVFRAPDLGHRGAVPARLVLDAARRAGLADVDVTGIAEVLVTREARFVPLADMEERIAAHVARALGVEDASRVAVRFDREARPLTLEPQAREPLAVARMSHDPRSGRFEAVLEVADSALSRRAGGFRLAGVAAETIEFVTPVRIVGRGETLRASDLILERRLRTETPAIPGDAAVDMKDVVGMAARQSLQPGRPVRRADLAKPTLVERGADVIIFYDIPGITLTVRGRAQEAGAEGDVVNVQNQQSRRIVQATVTGPNRVLVVSRTPVVLPPQAAASPSALPAALPAPSRN